MKADISKELQKEMVGVLTAISIVSKRLATRLMELDDLEKKDVNLRSEQNQDYLN